MQGKIKINSHTSGHRAVLERLGYSVEEVDGHLLIECTEFVGSADFTSAEAAKASVQALVQGRKLWTYTTEFRLRNPNTGAIETHSNFFALKKLPLEITALIAKPARGGGRKATSWVEVTI